MINPNYFPFIFLLSFIVLYNKFENKNNIVVVGISKCPNDTNAEYDFEFRFNYSTLLKQHNRLNASDLDGLPYFGLINGNFEEHTFQKFADHIYPIRNLTDIKCGDIIYVKGDNVDDFFKDIHPKIPNPYLLITHTSALSMGLQHQTKFLNDPKLITWFAKNAVEKHPKLKPLPLGLPPYNYSIIFESSKNPIPFQERNLTLYLNFSPETHADRYAIRTYVKMLYGNDSDVMIVEKWTSWDEYLTSLRSTKFIVSPPGVGLDCYRNWEAIIMGAIPIMLRSEISSLYDGLPVVLIDSWTDIKRENLKKFEIQYLSSLENGCSQWRPKIWARYWISQILEKKSVSKKGICKST